ncbi:MAG TPA: radical SAM protein [Planctomycetota bacterium]|nr:radical SAM protein [Planctomycetota bacterium]
MSELYPGENYIRPPNEASSVVIRVTKGCAWGRCRFCGIYRAMGVPFQMRPVADVLADIDRAVELYGSQERHFFLGDADPIAIPADDFVAIAEHLARRFPRKERLTAYGRAATAWRRRRELGRLRKAGLDRLHVGLETGDDALLRFHQKGISKRRMIDACRAIVDAGIELSLYVLLGLGGRDRWREHVAGTVEALNAVRPQFIRFRRLWIHPRCSLRQAMRAGEFEPQTPEGTVVETRDILAGLDAGLAAEVECMHHNDYVKLHGRLPEDKAELMGALDAFLALPAAEREAVYRVPSSI